MTETEARMLEGRVVADITGDYPTFKMIKGVVCSFGGEVTDLMTMDEYGRTDFIPLTEVAGLTGKEGTMKYMLAGKDLERMILRKKKEREEK